jgi:hypothetical protein
VPTRTVTTPIYDSAQLTHPRLREFAIQAAWISSVAEFSNDVEDLLSDVPSEEQVLPEFSTPWPWDFDPPAVALTVVRLHREEGARTLEDRVATWLGEDPETWQVVRLILIDPWQDRFGL